ncbi:MAG: Smr/MutS family protein [Pseudomonadota bacterium]
MTTRRIARGTMAIDARLDLHGMTQAQAHDRLHRFLSRAQAEGCRLVLVITGKGSRVDGAASRPGEIGILKRALPLWLEEPAFRSLVVGIDTAHKSHGGEGALYIRLRRRRPEGRR